MAEHARLLLPGTIVPQLGEEPISEFGRKNGFFIEQKAAVRQLDGRHEAFSVRWCIHLS